MRKILTYVTIPLFFFLYYFSHNGMISYFSLIIFLPFIFSFDSEKKHLLYKSLLVFLCGFLYFAINFSWFSQFYNWAIPVYSSMASFFHFVIPFIAYSALWAVKNKSFRQILLFASVWTLFEYVLQYFPITFPYNSIALFLFKDMILIQLLDTVGQFGISFLIILINGLLYMVILSLFQKQKKRAGKYFLTASVVLFIWTVYGIFSMRLHQFDKEIHIDLAQSNILSKEKTQLDTDSYLTLIGRFIEQKKAESDLILFPETFFYSDISDRNGDIYDYLKTQSLDKNITIGGGLLKNHLMVPIF